MIVPGKKILEAKAVSELINESQMQPCGIDLTVKEVHSFEDAGESMESPCTSTQKSRSSFLFGLSRLRTRATTAIIKEKTGNQ
ncbi:MAG: hypothetical protein NTV88_00895 [Candidatus Micrarchaeota archaeon]|nr:hypothetical protein [Candidatus Micrarchaeota archaeon]